MKKEHAVLRCAAAIALSGCAAGAALAQTESMPAESDRRWSLKVEALLATLKASPTPVPIVTDNYLDASGLHVGARAVFERGPWLGSVAGKVAFGTMQQRVSVNGFLETNDYTHSGRER